MLSLLAAHCVGVLSQIGPPPIHPAAAAVCLRDQHDNQERSRPTRRENPLVAVQKTNGEHTLEERQSSKRYWLAGWLADSSSRSLRGQ